MRGLLAAAVVLAGLAGPSVAHAQDAVFGFDAAERVLSFRTVDFRSTGSVGVTWESDPATCAAVGRCGLDGTLTYHLPRSGTMLVATAVRNGRRHRSVTISPFTDEEDELDSAIRARVRRATPDGSRLCADAGRRFAVAELPTERGRVSLGVIGGSNADFLATRCAGPTLADVAPALPTLTVPFSRIARGGSFIRLQGEGAFAGGGLRGRAVSTLALRLGRAERVEEREGVTVRGGRRVREIAVEYRVAEVRGEAGVDLAGAAAPEECGPLDSCGLGGTLRLLPAARRGDVVVFATTPASRGRRGARRAVGLLPGGAPPGTEAFGFGEFEGPGRAEVSLGRAGEDPCTDTVPLPRGTLFFATSRTRVRVAYAGADARTRCPGPVASFEQGVATADLPLTALGARRVEIPLTQGETFADQGWTATSRPAVTVVLERTRVVESVGRDPF